MLKEWVAVFLNNSGIEKLFLKENKLKCNKN